MNGRGREGREREGKYSIVCIGRKAEGRILQKKLA